MPSSPEPRESVTRARHRQLLIALNAADRIERGALCRLAADPDRWLPAGSSPKPSKAVQTLGVPPGQLARALEVASDAERLADREVERATRAGAHLVVRGDPDYPRSLTDLALPPPVLTCRGTLEGARSEDAAQRARVAIVGARTCNDYGRSCARRFARDLARAGVTVVSGFALGVDQAAHAGALEVTEGRTLAVLGCGIDLDYPRRSADLARRIAEQGAVISEFACGATPLPWRFPIRNRVIAALSAGVVVVQAKAKSGSLNSAHHALELGREIWAVPGRVDEALSAGPNGLLADGATVARSARDVLESLYRSDQQDLDLWENGPRHGATDPTPSPKRSPPPALTGLPAELAAALHDKARCSVDDLVASSGRDVERVLAALLELELSGLVVREPGPVYRL